MEVSRIRRVFGVERVGEGKRGGPLDHQLL